MTDNEIMKALECCSTNNQKCWECPLDSDCRMGVPAKTISRAALGLIQRQQERMDRIVELLEGLVQYNRDLILYYSGRRDITVPISYQNSGIEIAIVAVKDVLKGVQNE